LEKKKEAKDKGEPLSLGPKEKRINGTRPKRILKRASSNDSADEVVDTALVLATDKTDEALLTPRGAPRVLDDPVLGAVLNTVTDEEDTVVHASGGARALVDATAVEGPVGRINTDRERALSVESSDHGVLVLVDELPVREVVGSLGSIVLAGLVNTLVGVISLSLHALTDGIGEGIGHETTVAALIADLLGGARIDHAVLLAVNELLLGEGRKLLVGNKVDTLHVASGRESPARAALSLVLDGSDGTIGVPVLLLRIVTEAVDLEGSNLTGHGGDGHGAEVHRRELLLSHVSELVQGEEATALTVEVTDKSPVGLEGVELGNVLLSVLVALAKLDLPVGEVLIDISSASSGGEDRESVDTLHVSSKDQP